MATPVWQSGHLYQPGALVRPVTTPTVVQPNPNNPGFETGDLTGWTVDDPAIGVVGPDSFFAFEGSYVIRHPDGLLGTHMIDNDNIVPVVPGQIITAGCRYRRETNVRGRQAAAIEIRWFDAGMSLIPVETYFEQAGGGTNVWYNPAVTAMAPAGAAFAQLRMRSFQTGTGGTHHQYFDAFTWDYAFAGAPAGLIFRAVQAASGFSGTAEPVWPTAVGLTVVDNEVTWEGVLTSRVVWQATPILVSGATEPAAWPLEVGGTVLDGTIAWEAVSRRIEDARCPQSKVVAIAASKVFAADADIIAYCATVNPLDWSSPNDAGYLPFGLQTYGSNPVAAMGLYRGNLVAFNASGFQMWQVDQDPSSMALLDAIPVGCTYPKSIQPVSNDLAFLSSLGIRNVGIAGASTNLQSGDFGMAIDPLVQAKIAELAGSGIEPRGLYYPGQGQYWLFFGAEAFVLTMHGSSTKDMSWSRYIFPEAIDDWTVMDNDLYLRAGTLVWRVTDTALVDDLYGSGGVSDSIFQLKTLTYINVWNGTSYDQIDGTYGMSPGFNTILYLDGDIYDPDAAYVPIAPPSRISVTITVPVPVDYFHVMIEGYLDGNFQTETIEFNAGEATTKLSSMLYDELDLAEIIYPGDDSGVQAPTTMPLAIGLEGGGSGEELGIEFEGLLWWPYLDLRGLGTQAMLHGFDLVGIGEVSVQFAYDQSNLALVTPPYVVQAETLPGMPIAMPICAPSVQLRLTFSPNQAWAWNAAKLYDEPVTT